MAMQENNYDEAQQEFIAIERALIEEDANFSQIKIEAIRLREKSAKNK